MEDDSKILVRKKLAIVLKKVIDKNKASVLKNKANGKEDVSLVDGLRQLEAASGLSYTIIQGVSKGKRDLQFTTLVTLIEEGLGMSVADFGKMYDSITKKEIEDFDLGL